MTKAELASALEQIAETLKANPSPIVGMSVAVGGDASGGSATGVSISVEAVPGKSVTGLSISVDPSSSRDPEVIRELTQAVEALRSGAGAPKPWIEGLLSRVVQLGNRALDAAVSAAATAATNYYLKGGS